MNSLALFVKLEAKKGKEAEVEKFLKNGLNMVERETGTISWYALRLGPGTYAIFDTFQDNKGREAHLAGEVAKALKAKAPELFISAPVIEKADVLAAKTPEMEHH